MQSINLIPQEEIREQQKTFAVKLSTVFTVIILVIVSLVTAFFYYRQGILKSSITQSEKEIDRLRQEIQGMSEIEISARNLDKKFSVLKGIFHERSKYSLLLEELDARKPAGVDFDSLDVRDNTANLTGNAENYVAIAAFSNNLLDKNFSGGNETLKPLFPKVSLNTTNIDNSSNRVTFTIVITFDPTLLR